METGGDLRGSGRRVLGAWAGLVLGLSTALGDPTTPEPSKPQDLTGMSLEELLHEDITPINVLGSHTHPKGVFMVGYRYTFTDWEDNLDGTRRVSQSEVLQSYPVVHTGMTMQMHM